MASKQARSSRDPAAIFRDVFKEDSRSLRDSFGDERLNQLRLQIGLEKHDSVVTVVFGIPIEDGLIFWNPFLGMSNLVRSNKERQHYVDREVFANVLANAAHAKWRPLLVLARIGAWRIASEAQGLKWDHIAWDAKRISIAASRKTEHHARRSITQSGKFG